MSLTHFEWAVRHISLDGPSMGNYGSIYGYLRMIIALLGIYGYIYGYDTQHRHIADYT